MALLCAGDQIRAELSTWAPVSDYMLHKPRSGIRAPLFLPKSCVDSTNASTFFCLFNFNFRVFASLRLCHPWIFVHPWNKTHLTTFLKCLDGELVTLTLNPRPWLWVSMREDKAYICPGHLRTPGPLESLVSIFPFYSLGNWGFEWRRATSKVTPNFSKDGPVPA